MDGGLKRCVEKEISDGKLYELLVDFKTPKTKFSIAYDENFLNNTTYQFIKFFKEKVKDI